MARMIVRYRQTNVETGEVKTRPARTIYSMETALRTARELTTYGKYTVEIIDDVTGKTIKTVKRAKG